MSSSTSSTSGMGKPPKSSSLATLALIGGLCIAFGMGGGIGIGYAINDSSSEVTVTQASSPSPPPPATLVGKATCPSFVETANMSVFPPTSDTSGKSYEWNVYDDTLPSFTKAYPPGTHMCFGVILQVYNPLISAGILDDIQATSSEIAAGTTGLTKFQAWYATVTALQAGPEKTAKTTIYDIIVMLLYLFKFEEAASSGRTNAGTTYASKLLFEGMSGFPYNTFYTEFISKMNTLYATEGYTAWDLVKNSTMAPFAVMTKFTGHTSNIMSMSPYNGLVPAAVNILNGFTFNDPNGFFREVYLHPDFEETLSGTELIPTNFSGSIAAMAMYRAMMREYSFTVQATGVQTPYACTFHGRRIIAATSRVLGMVGSSCPSASEFFGLMQEWKEAVLFSKSAFSWIKNSATGTPVWTTDILDANGDASMGWYYRSIMTTAAPELISRCGTNFSLMDVGNTFGLVIDVSTLQQKLISMS